jgi:hypothetical protein
VQEFLDQAILRVMDEHPEEEVMEKVGTIEVLWRLLGVDALIPPEDRVDGIAARFSLRALEGIAVGLARNKDAILALPDPDTFIRKKKVGEFWMQPDVPWMSTPGLRGTVRLQRTVPFGAKWFNPDA